MMHIAFGAKSIGVLLLFGRVVSHSLRASDNIPRQSREVKVTSSTKDFDLASRHLQTDAQPQSSFYDGPSFTVGLEVNTTHNGEVNRQAIDDLLSTELYSYLFQELPYKYHLKEVIINDVQKLNAEPVRRLRALEQAGGLKPHEFVVTGSTEFSTDDIPSENELNELLLSIDLPPTVFHGSYNPVLKTTIGAKLFEVRSYENALSRQIDSDSEEQSVLNEYSTLIFLGSGFALITALAAISYYKMASDQSEKVEKNKVADVKSGGSSTEESKSNDEEAFGMFSCDKSMIGNGVLFVDSASASASDEELIEERGLNDETFSVCASTYGNLSQKVVSPNSIVARKVVEEVEGDVFGCGFEVPAPYTKTKPLDIDTVINDDDSEYARRRKEKNYRLKARVVNERIDHRMSWGVRSPMTKNSPLDIDAVVASDSEGDMDMRQSKTSKKRYHSGNENIELVPRIVHSTVRSRYQQKKQKRCEKRERRGRDDDIFSVVSDDSENGGCEGGCKSPKEVANEVIDEIIEEGYDCGMSLAGY